MKETKLISLYTESGEKLPETPWNIYPRPKMVRDSFICLNGEWDFTDSYGKNEKITVPFPPESILSGVGRRMGENPHIIYKKQFALNEDLVCKKVLLHYGSGSARRSGLLDRIEESLAEAGIAYTELGGVVPNPRLSLVYKGIELCKKEGVDFILAVGGGSVIDSAKAIGYGMSNEGDVWELYDRKNRHRLVCLSVLC